MPKKKLRPHFPDLSDDAIRRLAADTERRGLNQRQMTFLETARAVQGLIAHYEARGESLPGGLRNFLRPRVGKSGRTIDRYRLALRAPVEIQQALERGEISLVQAGKVAGLPAADQKQIAKEIRRGQRPRDVVSGWLNKTPKEKSFRLALKRLARTLHEVRPSLEENLARVSNFDRKCLPDLEAGRKLLPRLIRRIKTGDARGAILAEFGDLPQKLRRRRRA